MPADDALPKTPHAEKLGTILWRTLDRLEQRISDEAIEPSDALEIIRLVQELAGAVPGGRVRLDALLRHSSLSRIQPRTHGRSA
ncbi:MAG: hypothetical protein FJ144_18405 [Deltaproteobacteria bacterium]|nr:hypothetical protein [Deltaproteobacteria bacterium]